MSTPVIPPELNGWDCVGTVGVDTGHVLITDPCYAARLAGEFQAAIDAFALNKDAWGVGLVQETGVALGVIARSGVGDGIYNVYVRRSEDGARITHLLVDFTLTR
ncbi:MAG TPA: hypothetical protein VFE35_06875 [Candidatus Cybelea sp.]|jgi:hypothetical protein|nr:hypothetical protein [Candidatus Cybelea sp.]